MEENTNSPPKLKRGLLRAVGKLLAGREGGDVVMHTRECPAMESAFQQGMATQILQMYLKAPREPLWLFRAPLTFLVTPSDRYSGLTIGSIGSYSGSFLIWFKIPDLVLAMVLGSH